MSANELAAYAKGRRAAIDKVAYDANPFRDKALYLAWSKGHNDYRASQPK